MLLANRGVCVGQIIRRLYKHFHQSRSMFVTTIAEGYKMQQCPTMKEIIHRTKKKDMGGGEANLDLSISKLVNSAAWLQIQRFLQL